MSLTGFPMIATRDGQSCFLEEQQDKLTSSDGTIILLDFSFSPHKVSKTSGQVHCGRAAAEHGEDTLEVEQLQQLVVAEE